MKTVITLLVLFSAAIMAQNNFVLEGNCVSNFMYFLPPNNDLIYISSEEYKSTDDKNLSKIEQYINIRSKSNGNILKRVFVTDKKIIWDFIVSHDGRRLIVICSDDWHNKGPYIIKYYSLIEDRWVWEIELAIKLPLQLAYSEDDKNIYGFSAQKIIVIKSETGGIIQNSSKISSLNELEDVRLFQYDLSKNGKLAAFWSRKYLTFSLGDDGGPATLIDLFWYGLRWIYHFGSIPNYLYIWDIQGDSLYSKIKIPFETERGSPVFTLDEKEVLLEPKEDKFQVYNINNRKLEREFSYLTSYPIGLFNYPTGYKIISPDKLYFVGENGIYIYVNSYNSGKLLDRFEETSLLSVPLYRYAISFSPDSKYFATVIEGNKICLFDTGTWGKVWEVAP